MRIVSAESTELFVGPEHAALQVVAVTVVNDGRHRWSGGAPGVVEVAGNGLTTPEPSMAADVSPGDRAVGGLDDEGGHAAALTVSRATGSRYGSLDVDSADRLPTPGSGEDRRLRRWIVSALINEALVEAEVRSAGLVPPGGEHGSDALTLVFEHLTADVTVDDAEVARYHGPTPTATSGRSAGWSARWCWRTDRRLNACADAWRRVPGGPRPSAGCRRGARHRGGASGPGGSGGRVDPR